MAENTDRNSDGQFVKGNNCSRGPYGGRKLALQALDAILGKDENVEALRTALQTALTADPQAFFNMYVIPFAPKAAITLAIGSDNEDVKSPAEIAEDMAKATLGEKP